MGSEGRRGVADSRGGPGGDDVVHGGREYLRESEGVEGPGHRDEVRQGLEQGGRIRERALVRRLAARKFGTETAERLTRMLEDIADSDRIDEVFDAIVDCDSGAELFARVRA